LVGGWTFRSGFGIDHEGNSRHIGEER